MQHIRRSHAFGRLTLRNKERLSVVHLYFRAGKLVHVVGNKGDTHTILAELEEWTSGVTRFQRGATVDVVTTTQEHESLLEQVLLHLQSSGIVLLPPLPRVIDSEVIVDSEGEQLITPLEWRVLLEGTRRVLFAVAQLVGRQEALNVLRDILDDCSADFPAFKSLHVDPSGYLQVVDKSHLDRLPREELLAGFTALVSICEYFCVPIVGERQAHALLLQALRDVAPALASLGVFQVNTPQFV
jgi:hypothetical protein